MKICPQPSAAELLPQLVKDPACSTYETRAGNHPGHAGRKFIFNFDQRNNVTYLQS